MPVAELPESRGERLFNQHGCTSCHGTGHTSQPSVAPSLFGRFFDGDENYLRDSILRPSLKVAAGYPDIMPTYAGQFKEEEIIDLIRYLESGSNSIKRKDAAND